MAKEDVNIKVSSNVAEAIRMWQAMEEGPKGMADELEKLGRKGKKSSSSMSQEFSKLYGHWASVATGIAAAKALLDSYIEAQKEALRLTGDATTQVDELSRRFTIQGGLTNAEAVKARNTILATAVNRGFTPEGAFNPATQLVSSGFAHEEVTSGGSLDEFLKLLNATNATGERVDSAELAKTLVKFLKATGQEFTAASIRNNAKEIQGLFKATNIQTAGLETFAGKAAPITEATGLKKELLPIFSQFLDFVSDEVGGTAFRSSTISLATAGAEKTKIDALAQLGLKPEDVDFQGENFFDVQKLLAERFASVSPEVANIVAKRLFGSEGLVARQVLYSKAGVEETQRRMSLRAEDESFDRDRLITEGSLAAKSRASQSAEAKAYYDEDYIDPATARRVLLTKMKEAGYSDFSIGVSGQFFDYATEGSSWIPFSGGNDAAEAVRQAVVGGPTIPFVSFKQQRFINSVLEEARAQTPADIKVTVELQDQNAIAIPSKPTVNQLSEQ